MSKIDEIIQTGIAPGMRFGHQDPGGPGVKVPKALRELERGQRRGNAPISARDISKRFGMPIDFIRKTWKMAAVAGLCALSLLSSARAGDITRGTTVFDGQRLSAAQIHLMVDAATINSTFFTGKALNTTPLSSDYLLIWSPTTLSFSKVTLSSLVLNNAGLITGATAGIPVAPDQFLFYSQSAAGLRQTTFQSLLTNSWFITPSTAANFALATVQLMIYTDGTNSRISLSNLFGLFDYRTAFTNLPTYSAPTNNDTLLIRDSLTGSNKQITLIRFETNLTAMNPTLRPDLTTLKAVDRSTNIVRITMYDIGRSIVLRYDEALSGFTPNLTYTNLLGFTNDNNGPVLDRVTLKCVLADLGYGSGDFVNAEAIQWNGANSNTITYGHTDRRFFIQVPPAQSSTFPRILNKGGATMSAMDTNKWELHLNEIYFR